MHASTDACAVAVTRTSTRVGAAAPREKCSSVAVTCMATRVATAVPRVACPRVAAPRVACSSVAVTRTATRVGAAAPRVACSSVRLLAGANRCGRRRVRGCCRRVRRGRRRRLAPSQFAGAASVHGATPTSAGARRRQLCVLRHAERRDAEVRAVETARDSAAADSRAVRDMLYAVRHDAVAWRVSAGVCSGMPFPVVQADGGQAGDAGITDGVSVHEAGGVDVIVRAVAFWSGAEDTRDGVPMLRAGSVAAACCRLGSTLCMCTDIESGALGVGRVQDG